MADDLEAVSPEQYEVIKAVLGADAETFRRTKLGQYIYGRVANEEEQLIEDLIAADPEDAKANREIRNEIYKRRIIPKFIDDAIQSGRVATRNIDQMESSSRDY